uniref:hypothetical protein n=1 Tax=Acetatifactor sp. TaxID=1872090 RepID=UPI0040573B09
MYDQKLLSITECLNCHEKKCIIQFYDGAFGGKCDACGMTFAVDLNTVCELDDTEYKIYYVPMNYNLTEIKKILHHVSDNAYKIKKDTEMGKLIAKGRLHQVVSTIQWLTEEKILFHVTPVNPLERYDYRKKCRYAYCPFQQ